MPKFGFKYIRIQNGMGEGKISNIDSYFREFSLSCFMQLQSIFSIKFKHSNKFFPKSIFATKFLCGIEFGNLLFGGVYKCL